jgi:hypothetical protein
MGITEHNASVGPFASAGCQIPSTAGMTDGQMVVYTAGHHGIDMPDEQLAANGVVR